MIRKLIGAGLMVAFLALAVPTAQAQDDGGDPSSGDSSGGDSSGGGYNGGGYNGGGYSVDAQDLGTGTQTDSVLASAQPAIPDSTVATPATPDATTGFAGDTSLTNAQGAAAAPAPDATTGFAGDTSLTNAQGAAAAPAPDAPTGFAGDTSLTNAQGAAAAPAPDAPTGFAGDTSLTNAQGGTTNPSGDLGAGTPQSVPVLAQSDLSAAASDPANPFTTASFAEPTTPDTFSWTSFTSTPSSPYTIAPSSNTDPFAQFASLGTTPAGSQDSGVLTRGLSDLSGNTITASPTKDIQLERVFDPDFQPTVGPGSTGYAVQAVQQAVGVPQDGFFGPQTQSAVQQIQSINGLTPDGVVGPQTWNVFNGGTGLIQLLRVNGL